MRRLVLAICLTVACGGAQTTGSVDNANDTPGSWREVSSEHFVVWTNTSPQRARVLIRTMENLRQVVLGVSFFKKESKAKSFVIAFHTIDEVHEYAPPQFIAHAWPGRNVLLQPVIVLAAESLDHDRRIVTHELTHVISFNVIANQPHWFAEGLAGYFETVRLDESHATIDVGVPLENRFRELHDEGLTPVAELFACARPECMNHRFYATTWALFTYLLNEHPTQLAQYMERLIETPSDEQPQLWASVFPDLTPAKLDHELARWVHYGKIQVLKYTITLRDWPVSERPITPADVMAAKGLLRYLFAPGAGTPKETAGALLLDATNILANMVKAVAEKSVSPELAHSITAAHPDDWRAWWLAWHADTSGPERREARDKTCTLLEANPGAVPIEACARDASGAFAADPRQKVFLAATPQLEDCLKKSKPSELAATLSIDLDIADSGIVTAAHVSVGSPDTNACAEQVLKALTFPPHHGGPFHMGTSRPAHP